MTDILELARQAMERPIYRSQRSEVLLLAQAVIDLTAERDALKNKVQALLVDSEDDLRKLLALKDERDALREANRWIPVGERLPSGDCHPVYRYKDEHVWTEDYFCRIEFEGSIVFDTVVFDVNRSKWFRVDYDGAQIELNVTHWINLPAPE